MVNRERLSETLSSDKDGRCAISISLPSPRHPLFDGAAPLAYPTPAAYCFRALRQAQGTSVRAEGISMRAELVEAQSLCLTSNRAPRSVAQKRRPRFAPESEADESGSGHARGKPASSQARRARCALHC